MKPVMRKRSRVHRKPLTSLIIPLLVLQGESEEADFPRDEDLPAARFKLQMESISRCGLSLVRFGEKEAFKGYREQSWFIVHGVHAD